MKETINTTGSNNASDFSNSTNSCVLCSPIKADAVASNSILHLSDLYGMNIIMTHKHTTFLKFLFQQDLRKGFQLRSFSVS